MLEEAAGYIFYLHRKSSGLVVMHNKKVCIPQQLRVIKCFEVDQMVCYFVDTSARMHAHIK
jgi:hypothetical protein